MNNIEKILSFYGIETNKPLIGRFCHDKGQFYFDDIRDEKFASYKLNEVKGLYSAVVNVSDTDAKILNVGNYYIFDWKAEDTGSIQFNYVYSKTLVKLSAEDIVSRIYKNINGYDHDVADKINQTLDTLQNQLNQSGHEVFIYELLQNANDYPCILGDKKENVDVEFHFTDQYLIFRHSGAFFNPRNIAAICNYNVKEKASNKEAIGYKGIGFKTVFADNNYVLLKTGEYSFRFDESAKSKAFTPWQILPIWTDKTLYKTEIASVLSKEEEKYKVNFAFKPFQQEILKQRYPNLFKTVFNTERVILFIPNVYNVRVFFDSAKTPSISISKDTNKWLVSNDFTADVPKLIVEKINRATDPETPERVQGYERIPGKYYGFNRTTVRFACLKDGQKLKPVPNAHLYCYLPAKNADWGFDFLMNTDMVPNGPRDNVEDIELNHELAKIAGQQFFRWIQELVFSNNYDLDSIYSIIPDFEDCKEKHRTCSSFIHEFQNEFEKLLTTEAIVPVGDDATKRYYAPLNEVVCDDTGITSQDIMTDEEFLNLVCERKNAYLPINTLRNSISFHRFHKRYAGKSAVNHETLVNRCSSGSSFLLWLKDIEHNCRFLDFLLSEGVLNKYVDKRIFIMSTQEMERAEMMYGDISNHFNGLEFLLSYIPRLADKTVETLRNNKSWGKFANDHFMKFDALQIFKTYLFKPNSKEACFQHLSNIDASLRLFEFLSDNNINPSFALPSDFPLIGEDEQIYTHSKSSPMFFYSEHVWTLTVEKWMPVGVIRLISHKYQNSKKVTRSLLEFGIKEFSEEKLISDIVNKEGIVQEINNHIQNDAQDNLRFVKFMFANRKYLEKEGLLEKFILRCRRIDETEAYTKASEAYIFAQPDKESDFYQCKEYSWMPIQDIYTLHPYYVESCDEKEIRIFQSFLHQNFGVKNYTNRSFYLNVIIPNKKKIFAEIKDQEVALSFIKYLSINKTEIFVDSFSLQDLKEMPLLDCHGEIYERNSYPYHFLYDTTAEDLVSQQWFSNSAFKILSPEYEQLGERALLKLEFRKFQMNDAIRAFAESSGKKTIIQEDENILFWRWVCKHQNVITDFSDLRYFPMLNDKDGLDTKAIDLYIPDCYLSQPGIEATVRKYSADKASFVSKKLLQENGELSKQNWMDLFNHMQLKKDNEDILFNNVLPSLGAEDSDETLLFLAQYIKEIESKWDYCAPRLKKLKVRTNHGTYAPAISCVMISPELSLDSEPFPYIHVTMGIAPELVKTCGRLLIKIAKLAENPKIIKSRTEWANQKIKHYVSVIQSDTKHSVDENVQFIKDLADFMFSNEGVDKELVNRILFLDKNDSYHQPSAITLGTAFHPSFDFEKFGVDKNYLSERYIEDEKMDVIVKLLRDLPFRRDFTRGDIGLLKDKDVAIEFWQKVFKSRTTEIKEWINNGLLKNAPCIPTDIGVSTPTTVYAPYISGYSKFCASRAQMMVSKDVLDNFTSEEFNIFCGLQFMNKLTFEDCLDYLEHANIPLNQDKECRGKVLEWIYQSSTRNSHAVEVYRNSEASTWRNGKNSLKPIRTLSIIDHNAPEYSIFSSDEHIMQSGMFGPNLAELCKILQIPILHSNDFMHNPINSVDETNKQIAALTPRILVLAAKQGENKEGSFKEIYQNFIQKLNNLHFYRCDAIDLSCGEIHSDSERVYQNEKHLYYVGQWDGKRTYEPFCSKLSSILGIDVPKQIKEDIFDNENSVDTCIEKYCAQMQYDKEFVSLMENSGQSVEQKTDEVTSEGIDEYSQYQNYLTEQNITNKHEEADSQNSNQNTHAQNISSKTDLEATQRKSPTQPDHTAPQPKVPFDNEDIDEENCSIEKRLKEKWEKMKNEQTKRPSSPTNTSNTSPYEAQSSTIDNETETYDDTKGEYNSERRSKDHHSGLKKQNTEAQKQAQKAQDNVDIEVLLESTEKYTYLWFKYLMELLYSDKAKPTPVNTTILFNGSQLLEDGNLSLTDPSRVIPVWLEAATFIEISSVIGNKRVATKCKAAYIDKAEIIVAPVDEQSHFSFYKECGEIRLIAEGDISNFISSFQSQFLKLDFANDYSLRDNLTTNIKYLYGPPGTGKTTKLVKDIRNLISDNKPLDILVLTPTNQAADVIARMMIADNVCSEYMVRYGTTESMLVLNEGRLVNRDIDFMIQGQTNIVITTAARYSYDYLKPDDVMLCDHEWDYIVIDEASMLDILTITYILFKGTKQNANTQFIIAGDPKQIEPIECNGRQPENIYQMVGINDFAKASTMKNVECLTVQHRSVPMIGKFVSDLSYNGIVRADNLREPQKPLNIDGFQFKDINYIWFKTEVLDRVYGLDAVNDSAFHLYSVILTYEMVDYMVKQINDKYPNTEYSIGIVCPYGAQAKAISQLLEKRPLDINSSCTVHCGTVHSFQGDQCDIVFVVMNPPMNITSGTHINNENIINVALSRARDYLFILLPGSEVKNFDMRERLGKHFIPGTGIERNVMKGSDVEKVIFGQENYIYENTSVTCHLPVNVFYEPSKLYEVRKDDVAVDIQINEQFRNSN